jgi:Domain of unknown function (DUF4276)
MTIVPIVEGDGEVAALPILLRRLCEWKFSGTHVEIARPIRVRKDQFLNREPEFNRHIQLACSKAGENGCVFTLLDADDDCPVSLAADIQTRALLINATQHFATIIANREYEAWLVAAAPSINGKRGFSLPASDQSYLNPEMPRNAKGWIRERLSSASYRETLDQPAFTAEIDLQLAHTNSRSFRKLCAELDRYVNRFV